MYSSPVGFDFISKFGLDAPVGQEFKGVTKILGSNAYQVAFNIGNDAMLLIPTRFAIWDPSMRLLLISSYHSLGLCFRWVSQATFPLWAPSG